MMLVFGQTGQVARELARLVPDARFVGRAEADLTNPGACHDLIAAAAPTCVINAAAYTAVDRAEAERDTAFAVNADAPGAMAAACAARDIPFLHLSTDYVFDGAGNRPWQPGDATGPLGAYGASKLAGEMAVRASGARAVILRTSWVFSAHGTNFVKTMLRLGATRERLNVVADQIGGPTPAAAIAGALVTMARAMQDGHPGGTYHLSGGPDTSWAGFARAIMADAGLACVIDDIPSSDYPTPAPRPLNSRLDCHSLSADFGLARPDWRAGLADVLKEIHHG